MQVSKNVKLIIFVPIPYANQVRQVLSKKANSWNFSTKGIGRYKVNKGNNQKNCGNYKVNAISLKPIAHLCFLKDMYIPKIEIRMRK